MMIKTAAHFMTDPFTIDSPNFNHNGGTFCQKIDMRTVGGAFFECVKNNFSVKLHKSSLKCK